MFLVHNINMLHKSIAVGNAFFNFLDRFFLVYTRITITRPTWAQRLIPSQIYVPCSTGHKPQSNLGIGQHPRVGKQIHQPHY